MYRSTCITNSDPGRTQHDTQSPQQSQLDLSCFFKTLHISHSRGNLGAGHHIHETKTHSSNKVCSSFPIPSTSRSTPFTHQHSHTPTQMSGHQVPPQASSAAHITCWGPNGHSWPPPGEMQSQQEQSVHCKSQMATTRRQMQAQQ